MQRRHYEFIAETIRTSKWNSQITDEARAAIAREFAGNLAVTYPNFKRERFLKACGVEL